MWHAGRLRSSSRPSWLPDDGGMALPPPPVLGAQPAARERCVCTRRYELLFILARDFGTTTKVFARCDTHTHTQTHTRKPCSAWAVMPAWCGCSLHTHAHVRTQMNSLRVPRTDRDQVIMPNVCSARTLDTNSHFAPSQPPNHTTHMVDIGTPAIVARRHSTVEMQRCGCNTSE